MRLVPMRYLIYLLLALPLVVPAQAPEPTFRSTTSEVLLDFVVRDKSGRIIRDLRSDEVQVLENGTPQKVRHFEFFNGRSVPEPATAPNPAAIASASPSPSPSPAPVTSPTDNQLRDISVVSLVIAD